MNSKTLLIILALIIIFVGWSVVSNDSTEMENLEETVVKESVSDQSSGVMVDEEVMETEAMEERKSGNYEPYSSEKLAMADNGDVVLFFKASWCPTCRALDKDIKLNLENIPENVSILSVDYDSSTELKQKYGVTYQHTLVQVNSSGELIAKWTSSPTLKALLLQIK